MTSHMDERAIKFRYRIYLDGLAICATSSLVGAQAFVQAFSGMDLMIELKDTARDNLILIQSKGGKSVKSADILQFVPRT